VGTGDLQQEVYPLFDNHPWGIEPNKPHLQFLEIGVKFGLFGVLIFVFGWVWQAIRIRGPGKILFYCFSLLCFISMMTESTLDTQAGISFFVVMGTLLLKSSEEIRDGESISV
jgi:O-antigen ligase